MSSQPPPIATSFQPPVVAYAARDVDDEQLRTLAICHFVWAGLLAFFACIPIIHVVLGVMIVSGAMPMNGPAGTGQPPFDQRWFGWIFIVMGGSFVLLGWTLAIFTLISGLWMRRRQKRMASIVIAAINCVMVPFGTVLGVFTLIVLVRESVRLSYLGAKPTAA